MRPDLLSGNYSKFISIIESLHDDIVISDGRGMIQYVSQTFLNLYNVREEEILGKSVYDLERKGVFFPAAVSKVLAKKGKVTFLQKTKNGDHFVITAVPVLGDDGKISRIISYSNHLPELMALRKHYEELESQMKMLSTEVRELREKEIQIPGIVAQSALMKNILKLALKVAEVDINLLITGESGVGKNLIARFIHQRSPRKNNAFIEINCGAIPESLLESELFGYEPGAFTGARKEGKVGMIELAHGGTLFLDEIGDLPLSLQVKLLKVIQEKTFTKVGGGQPIDVDFRLISATNQDLESRIMEKKFRKDLFYRLNVVPVVIPPLRERHDDILMLITQFLEHANCRFNKQNRLSSRVIDILVNYDWPGNVRELQNLIDRIVITADNRIIQPEDLPAPFTVDSFANTTEETTLKAAKERIEKQLVVNAYCRHKTTGAVGKALGISQATAVRKINKYRAAIEQQGVYLQK